MRRITCLLYILHTVFNPFLFFTSSFHCAVRREETRSRSTEKFIHLKTLVWYLPDEFISLVSPSHPDLLTVLVVLSHHHFFHQSSVVFLRNDDVNVVIVHCLLVTTTTTTTTTTRRPISSLSFCSLHPVDSCHCSKQ